MQRSDRLFRALGDETRRRTLAILRLHELSVSELVEALQQPQSTVSRHLRVLSDAGLLRDRRDGTTVLYSVRPAEQNGNGADLSAKMIEWIGEQALPPPVERRLRGVIERRAERSRRFFSRAANEWDRLREEAFGAAFHLEAFLSLLPPSWTLADVGTGTGYLLPALSRHFRKVIAVDPVSEMLTLARKRVEAERLENVELRQGHVERLPLDDGAVDLAVALLVLHHVSDPKNAIRELARIVRPGGRILIVEPSTHHDAEFFDRMQDRWWGFAEEDMSRWLAEAGVTPTSCNALATQPAVAAVPKLFVLSGERGKAVEKT